MWLVLVVGLFLSPIQPSELNEEKPVLLEISLPKKLAENQAVRLSCALLQGHSVGFEWTFNGEKLTENARRRIIYHEDSSDLMIKSLSVDDLGDFQCIAKNSQGEDTQRVSLFFDGECLLSEKFSSSRFWLVKTKINRILTQFRSSETQIRQGASGRDYGTLERNFTGMWCKRLPDSNQSMGQIVRRQWVRRFLNFWFCLSCSLYWQSCSLSENAVLKEFKSNRISFELTKESAGVYRCRSHNAVGSIEKTVTIGFYGKTGQNKWTGKGVIAFCLGVFF